MTAAGVVQPMSPGAPIPAMAVGGAPSAASVPVPTAPQQQQPQQPAAPQQQPAASQQQPAANQQQQPPASQQQPANSNPGMPAWAQKGQVYRHFWSSSCRLYSILYSRGGVD